MKIYVDGVDFKAIRSQIIDIQWEERERTRNTGFGNKIFIIIDQNYYNNQMNKLIIFLFIILLTTQYSFVRLSSIKRIGESLGDTLKRVSLGFNRTIAKPTLRYNSQIMSSVENLQITKLLNNFTYPLPSITIDNSQVDSAVIFKDQNKIVCTYSLNHYSNSTSQFLHFDTNQSQLYPGSLLTATNITQVFDGTSLQTPIPVNPALLRPQLTIFDQLKPRYVDSLYSQDQIQNNIALAIQSDQAGTFGPDVYYDFGTTGQLADFGNRLGFNEALLNQIGIASNPSSFTSFEKKYIFMFVKAMGAFNVAIQQIIPKRRVTPFMVFFKDMSTNQFNSFVPTYWGNDNTPLYISQAIYGSIMFITVDQNLFTTKIYNEFASAAQNGDLGHKIVSLLQQATGSNPNYYSYGSFGPLQKKDIKADLTTFVNWFQNPDPSVTNIKPILYSVSSFDGKLYNCQNQFNYTTIACAKSN